MLTVMFCVHVSPLAPFLVFCDCHSCVFLALTPIILFARGVRVLAIAVQSFWWRFFAPEVFVTPVSALVTRGPSSLVFPFEFDWCSILLFVASMNVSHPLQRLHHLSYSPCVSGVPAFILHLLVFSQSLSYCFSLWLVSGWSGVSPTAAPILTFRHFSLCAGCLRHHCPSFPCAVLHLQVFL